MASPVVNSSEERFIHPTTLFLWIPHSLPVALQTSKWLILSLQLHFSPTFSYLNIYSNAFLPFSLKQPWIRVVQRVARLSWASGLVHLSRWDHFILVIVLENVLWVFINHFFELGTRRVNPSLLWNGFQVLSPGTQLLLLDGAAVINSTALRSLERGDWLNGRPEVKPRLLGLFLAIALPNHEMWVECFQLVPVDFWKGFWLAKYRGLHVVGGNELDAWFPLFFLAPQDGCRDVFLAQNRQTNFIAKVRPELILGSDDPSGVVCELRGMESIPVELRCLGDHFVLVIEGVPRVATHGEFWLI